VCSAIFLAKQIKLMAQVRNSEQAWGLVTKLVHWTIALCIFTAMITAILNNQLLADDPWQRSLATQLMNVHRSCGITAMVLGIFRVLWMFRSLRPPLPVQMNEVDRRATNFGHRAIYTLALLVPATGWMTTALFGTTFEWFWLFEVSNPVDKDRALVPWFYHAHWILYHLLLVFVIVHVAFACWHHFSQKDDVLRQMLPWPTDKAEGGVKEQ
jgi:cytochrome b561